MTDGLNSGRFAERLDQENRSNAIRSRVAAYFSATIAAADNDVMVRAIEIGRSKAVERRVLYETMLQSYLILGFPRMLGAAAILAESWPDDSAEETTDRIKDKNWKVRYEDGIDLCRQVYGDNFEKLRSRVMAMSPDVFHLMITEGYGKMYQRPGLSVIDRELSNVSALMVENRLSQLHSHIRGALNVGTTGALISAVIEDVGSGVGPGYEDAVAIIKRVEAT